LRNLLHLIGDIHQPLHATTRYTPTDESGDAGGNGFKLNVSAPGNLHGFWDSGLGLLNNSIVRPLNSDAADYLSNMADMIMAYTANITINATWTNSTEWAMESYYLAIEYAYNITEWSTPSAEYIAAGWPIVQQRLGLAGYRLAQVLKNNIVTCSAELNNCPNLDQSNSPSDERWTIVAIVLAVVLGGSVLANIVLTYSVCKRRSHDHDERRPLRS